MSTLTLRPRSATEIIDAAFQLLRQRYFQYVALVVVALMPYLVLQFAVSAMGTTPLREVTLRIVQLLCTVIAEGTLIVAVSDSYLEGGLDIGSALRRSMSRVFAILGAAIARGFLVIVAMLPVAFGVGLLAPSFVKAGGAPATAGDVVAFAIVGAVFILGVAIPATYVGLRTFATTAVLLIERTSVEGAIARGWRLAKGEVGRIFVALLLAWLLYLVLFLIFTVAVGLFLGGSESLVAIFTAVILAFAYPLIGVVTTLLYYDLRVRHEGFDLEVMAKQMEG